MKILAVETATEACSAALLNDGEVSERYEVSPREHSRLVLPMMQSLLDDAGLKNVDLDALAFGCGPGSFTGLRIAAGVIQGMAFATGLPVVPVSTLAALAQDGLDRFPHSYAFAALDARMGEVYWGVYRRSAAGLATPAGSEVVASVEDVVAPAEATGVGIGSGWATYGERLGSRFGERIDQIETTGFPRAASVVRLAADAFARGVQVSAEQAVPVYLRNQVARKKGE